MCPVEVAGIGKRGHLSVTNMVVFMTEVDRKRIEHTVAGRFGIDTFGVGADTGAPVSNDYTPPFAYTGVIDRIEIELGQPRLDPEEDARLHARFAAGKDD